MGSLALLSRCKFRQVLIVIFADFFTLDLGTRHQVLDRKLHILDFNLLRNLKFLLVLDQKVGFNRGIVYFCTEPIKDCDETCATLTTRCCSFIATDDVFCNAVGEA